MKNNIKSEVFIAYKLKTPLIAYIYTELSLLHVWKTSVEGLFFPNIKKKTHNGCENKPDICNRSHIIP